MFKFRFQTQSKTKIKTKLRFETEVICSTGLKPDFLVYSLGVGLKL